MPKRDRAPIGIHLLLIQPQLLDAPHALTRKRLIDLIDINFGGRDTGFGQRNGDRFPGADAHEERGYADDGGGDEFTDNGLRETLGGGALHEEDGGRAVGDLGRIARVDTAVFGEGGFDFREGSGCDAWSDAIILGNGNGCFFVGFWVDEFGRHGRDFGVEATGLLGQERFGIRRGREGVLVAAGNVAVFGHLFAEGAHGHFATFGFRMAFEEVGEFGHCARAVLRRHGLNTATYTYLDHTGADGVGYVRYCLESAAALPVETSHGSCFGESGDESGCSEFGGACAWSEDIADCDVLDKGRVYF